MPLLKLRCKQDHMLKSIARILFNSKWEVERQKETAKAEGSGGGGRKEREREIKQKKLARHGALRHPTGLSSPWFSVVGVPESSFWRNYFYKVEVGDIHGE